MDLPISPVTTNDTGHGEPPPKKPPSELTTPEAPVEQVEGDTTNGAEQ